MKYVMFMQKKNLLTVYHPVIFANHMVHDEVAHALLKSESLTGFTVDSAGEYDPVSVECYGRSKTLGVDSKPNRDAEIIRTHDYGGGMK